MTDHGSPPASQPAGSGAHQPSDRPSGLYMGRPFGIPVYVSGSWLIIAGLITLLYQPVVEDTLALGPLSYLVAFVFAVLLYASVLVHELAHCVVARLYGLRVHWISLYMLGGVSQVGEARAPGREFWVAFSGPLVSLVLAALGFVAYQFTDPVTVAGVLVWQLWVANLVVGVFNLLPGLPLDGGRLVRAVVWALTGRPMAGTVVAAWAGRALAVLVVTLPFLLSLLAGTSPSMVAVVWAVLLASFIWINAGSSLRSARIRERLPGLSARGLARPTVWVPADTSLAEARRRMAEPGASAILVADTGGTPTSIVNDAAAAAVPDTRRPWIPVSNVARAITPGAVLRADLEGEALLEAMRQHPLSEYLVREADGSIRGVLRAADVNAAFAGT